MSAEDDRQKLIELMVAYQNGEAEAFSTLYRLLRPTLWQYLLNRTFNRTIAEDLLQESFLQLHRSRQTYLPGKPVLPWALAITRHVFLMHRRSTSRRGRHETQPDELPAEIAVPANLDGVADRHTLRRALLALASDQREVLLMHYSWGLTFREIAGILGIGRSAAKIRSYRGIRLLRRTLAVTTR